MHDPKEYIPLNQLDMMLLRVGGRTREEHRQSAMSVLDTEQEGTGASRLTRAAVLLRRVADWLDEAQTGRPAELGG